MPPRPRSARPTRGDDAPELAELAGLETTRARLDARELELVEQARRDGVTWTAIAQVWGLASRQAAEQRFVRLSERLARQAARGREPTDAPFGPEIVAVRRAAAALLHALRSDQRWTSGFGRTALARATLQAAVEAPPGALYHLLVQAIADIDAGVAGAAGAPPTSLRLALDDARTATRNAINH